MKEINASKIYSPVNNLAEQAKIAAVLLSNVTDDLMIKTNNAESNICF